jgi:predicted transcriptional regulator
MIVPEERSPLQTIAVICVKLDQGEPEEKIREYLDIEDELFAFCIEFALENNLIIKQESGRYEITRYGKEFASVF